MMGKPMAKNLLKAGYELTVLDVNTAAVEELVGEGAVRAGNPVEVMSQCEAVITMLPGSADVEQVVLGAQGLLSAIRDEHLVIDMSTIDPMVSKRLALEIDAAGGQMIDAPVSGGETGAINGTLTIMVGGPAAVLDRCREVLAVMGNKLIHAGSEAGMGGKIKLVNNMITGISMIAPIRLPPRYQDYYPFCKYPCVAAAGPNDLDNRLHREARFQPCQKSFRGGDH
jgi:2-hydroxy-3-oxopropionate reductase